MEFMRLIKSVINVNNNCVIMDEVFIILIKLSYRFHYSYRKYQHAAVTPF